MLILACFGIKNVLNLPIPAVKLYLDSAKYGIYETEKLPNISLSPDFVNKPPPLSNKPPSGRSEIK